MNTKNKQNKKKLTRKVFQEWVSINKIQMGRDDFSQQIKKRVRYQKKRGLNSRSEACSLMRPPKAQLPLYSSLPLQTDSSFTGGGCWKWDWLTLSLLLFLSSSFIRPSWAVSTKPTRWKVNAQDWERVITWIVQIFFFLQVQRTFRQTSFVNDCVSENIAENITTKKTNDFQMNSKL